MSTIPIDPFHTAHAQQELAPLPLTLEYHDHDEGVPDEYLGKTLAGFGVGALLTGLMLNFAAVFVLHPIHNLWAAKLEFFTRAAFLMGLSFVGTSLLLVALKCREDHADEPLHSRHWLASLALGGIYALLVFGPGLVAERSFPVNTFAQAAIWMAVLVVPVASSFYLVFKARLAH